MPRFTGTLTIVGADSDLAGTALAKTPLSGDPFGRATTFLIQDRKLSSGNRIWVDGNPSQIGEVPVILITNAGRELPALVGPGGALRAVNAAKKGGAKKGGAKKNSAKKSAAKKSGGKKGGGK